MIEVTMDFEPVDFVELMLDGKPLKPEELLDRQSIEFSDPMPCRGRHYLQARFLSGNIWSVPVEAARFRGSPSAAASDYCRLRF